MITLGFIPSYCAKRLSPLKLFVLFFAGICRCWGNDLDTEHLLQIKADQLATALVELGSQTSTNILIVDRITDNIQITQLSGLHSTRAALDTLLKNSDYQYKQVGQQSIAIIRNKTPAQARAPLELNRSSTIETIEVLGHWMTGSHIRKTQNNAIAPIDIITAEQLARSGTQSLAELLKFTPSVSGNSTSTAVSNGGDGTTKVALRGLPANNTLVLVNGHRAVFDGLAGDSVDLNTMAPIAIQSLDIYKDGASAIYGSDAIAGVINIHMLERYNGVKLEHYNGITSKGDTHTKSTNGLIGKTSDTHSALLALSYYRQDGLFSRDRVLSASADGRAQGGQDKRTSASPYTSLTLPDGQNLILNTAPPADSITPNTHPARNSVNDYRPTTTEDLFNFREQTSTISPSSRLSLYGNAQHSLNDHLTVQSFALFSQTKAAITLAPTPIYTAFLPEPITVSQSNIYNPFNLDITDLRRRLIELEPRTQINKANSLYTNIGFQYHVGQQTIKTHFFWNTTQAQEHRNNLIDAHRLRQALGPSSQCLGQNIDGCTPINLFTSPQTIPQEQLAFIKTAESAKGESHIYGFNAQLNKRLDWQAKSIDYAIGMNARKERSEFSPNHNNSPSTIGSVVKAPVKSTRSILEMFSELYIPLRDKLPKNTLFDIELAARYTYSRTTTNNLSPKIGLRFSLTPSVLMRATYSRGFRTPSIRELYTEGTLEYSALNDPCALTQNINTYSGCITQSDSSLNQFLVQYSGSTDLKPEVSSNYVLGLHATPLAVPNLSFSIDAYTINVVNVIHSSPQTIVDENARIGAFKDFVRRDSNGNITLINAPLINIGDRQVTGADIHLHYRPTRNTTQYTLNASYLHSYRNHRNNHSINNELAGTFRDIAGSGDGALPRWKINAGFHFPFKNFIANYAINYIGAMSEHYRNTQGNTDTRRISSWVTFDAQLRYATSTHPFSISLGIENLLDRQPPFIASAFNDNYDARTYDLKGRYLYFTVGAEF